MAIIDYATSTDMWDYFHTLPANENSLSAANPVLRICTLKCHRGASEETWPLGG